MFFTYLASSPVSLAEVHGKHGGRATFEENGDNNYFAASVDVDVGDLDDDNELTTITMLMNNENSLDHIRSLQRSKHEATWKSLTRFICFVFFVQHCILRSI